MDYIEVKGDINQLKNGINQSRKLIRVKTSHTTNELAYAMLETFA
jgi:hypothetical protein